MSEHYKLMPGVTVDMHDDPATLLRRKPDSSMCGQRSSGAMPRSFAGNTGTAFTGATLYAAAASGHPTRGALAPVCRARRTVGCMLCDAGASLEVTAGNAAPPGCVPRFAVRGEKISSRVVEARVLSTSRHGGYQG